MPTDGDGKRVKRIDNGITTTVFIGNLYEKNLTTGITRTYYFAGAQGCPSEFCAAAGRLPRSRLKGLQPAGRPSSFDKLRMLRTGSARAGCVNCQCAKQ